MKNGSPSPSASSSRDLRSDLGRRGEEIAAAFFVAQGFRILTRNWRCRFGEIDLIVQKGVNVRFIEVKMRRTHAYGYPEAAITPQKLRHMQAAAELWLKQASFQPKDYQMDVLAISCVDSRNPQFVWIEGV